MKISANKDLRRILKDAEDRGWEFKLANHHIKGQHTSGKTVTISRSPSDWRALLNIRRDLGAK